MQELDVGGNTLYAYDLQQEGVYKPQLFQKEIKGLEGIQKKLGALADQVGLKKSLNEEALKQACRDFSATSIYEESPQVMDAFNTEESVITTCINNELKGVCRHHSAVFAALLISKGYSCRILSGHTVNKELEVSGDGLGP